ncbi:hypothetical protein COU54_00685 [Candidatus Pacearchaeota archaeon CG10_big_fil_rev_8_21_14_0_10_31_24]|nr:MAG: hypothetical protein COU54_00685 [Candidatus Pacearchaeota archaeon CG10_big_fil_rev_8_21_14_0_10_31_24]
MKDEIIGGIRNALERGEPMEKVVQSFINAGYNADQVNEVANRLSPASRSISESSILQSTKNQLDQKPQDNKISSPQPSTQTQTTTANLPKTQDAPPTAPVQPLKSPKLQLMPNPNQKKSKKTVIILAVILFLLVIGLVLTFLFSDSIISKFSG